MGTASIRIGVIIRTLVVSKAYISSAIAIISNYRRKTRGNLCRNCDR